MLLEIGFMYILTIKLWIIMQIYSFINTNELKDSM